MKEEVSKLKILREQLDDVINKIDALQKENESIKNKEEKLECNVSLNKMTKDTIKYNQRILNESKIKGLKSTLKGTPALMVLSLLVFCFLIILKLNILISTFISLSLFIGVESSFALINFKNYFDIKSYLKSNDLNSIEKNLKESQIKLDTFKKKNSDKLLNNNLKIAELEKIKGNMLNNINETLENNAYKNNKETNKKLGKEEKHFDKNSQKIKKYYYDAN